MKAIYFLTLALLSLAGCECMKCHNPNWNHDCKTNYSETSYEFSACKDKVEANRDFAQEAGTVGLVPEGTDLPATDELRKSRGVGN